MVPVGSGFDDMTNGDGLPGQNSANPSEKIFGSHYILQMPTGIPPAGQGPYFDPSYGAWYANRSDFESKAVAFYAQPEANVLSSGTALYTLWGVRVPTSTTNICFGLGSSPGSYGACD